MKPICENCKKEIGGVAYRYNMIVVINDKIVKGNDLLMCSKECCCKYDEIAEKSMGTGFMCRREIWPDLKGGK